MHRIRRVFSLLSLTTIAALLGVVLLAGAAHADSGDGGDPGPDSGFADWTVAQTFPLSATTYGNDSVLLRQGYESYYGSPHGFGWLHIQNEHPEIAQDLISGTVLFPTSTNDQEDGTVDFYRCYPELGDRTMLVVVNFNVPANSPDNGMLGVITAYWYD